MSPDLRPCCGCVRSAALLNELIRRLMLRTGGRLQGADREEYQRLRAEWVKAA